MFVQSNIFDNTLKILQSSVLLKNKKFIHFCTVRLVFEENVWKSCLCCSRPLKTDSCYDNTTLIMLQRQKCVEKFKVDANM
ncbi:CLUMA_CG017563, isoform A [Clunio marinus]|uniref:CLUMA_CG017563, isoform A n=1 Tax=Clunio marinus TaxID=568069 RepID=A0A1J1IXP0_9DIPT|nr:CLUMA_CG017563, isoform A [Clunio marinus]